MAQATIERLVDQATDSMLFQVDFDVNLQLVDAINNDSDINAADIAVTRLRDRFKQFQGQDQVLWLCIELLDFLTKNCYNVAKYVARQDIVTEVLNLAKTKGTRKAQERAMEMVQYYGTTEAWGADPDVFWPWAYQSLLTTGVRMPPKGVDDFKPLKKAAPKPAPVAHPAQRQPQHGGGDASSKLRREIVEVNESATLLREILGNLGPNEKVADNDLLTELAPRIKQMHQNMVKMIETNASKLDEDLLASLIATNDSTSEALALYDSAKNGGKPAPAAPVPAPAPARPLKSHEFDISGLPAPVELDEAEEEPLQRRRQKKGWAQLPPPGPGHVPAPIKSNPHKILPDDLLINFNEGQRAQAPVVDNEDLFAQFEAQSASQGQMAQSPSGSNLAVAGHQAGVAAPGIPVAPLPSGPGKKHGLDLDALYAASAPQVSQPVLQGPQIVGNPFLPSSPAIGNGQYFVQQPFPGQGQAQSHVQGQPLAGNPFLL